MRIDLVKYTFLRQYYQIVYQLNCIANNLFFNERSYHLESIMQRYELASKPLSILTS